MIISDRIFARINELSMTQVEFSDRTGIPPTTISEWKRRKTNPTSEKIMIIREVLMVSPEWLLTGVDPGTDSNASVDYYIIGKDTEIGILVEKYRNLSAKKRERLLGYLESLEERV